MTSGIGVSGDTADIFRLCLDDVRLRESNLGIAFAKQKRKLPIIGG